MLHLPRATRILNKNGGLKKIVSAVLLEERPIAAVSSAMGPRYIWRLDDVLCIYFDWQSAHHCDGIVGRMAMAMIVVSSGHLARNSLRLF